MSIVIGVAVLLYVLYLQVRERPLKESYRGVIILGIIGVLELGGFVLGGGQQAAAILKGQRAFSTIPDAGTVVIAAVGSLVLAVITGALRTPTIRLWLRDGQAWRQGTWLTAVLWIVSLALHLGYDELVAHGTGQAQIGSAMMVLFLAASLLAQRLILTARARRLRASSPVADNAAG